MRISLADSHRRDFWVRIWGRSNSLEPNQQLFVKLIIARINICGGLSMQINGVAHTFITAGNFATARAFYGQLLPFMGLTIVADTANTFYCVGGRTGFGIHAPAEEYAGQRFRQGSPTAAFFQETGYLSFFVGRRPMIQA